MRFIFSAILCTLLFVSSSATPKYWVGPTNGNWSNSANWSLSNRGVGFAGTPGIGDSVVLLEDALINLDISPTILSLTVGSYPSVVSVRFYTERETSFTILSNLLVDQLSTLKDSTSADVKFNVIFSGISGARGTILGNWEFEGGVPVSNTGGALFTAENGARVLIGAGTPISSLNSAVIFKNYSGDIASTTASLIFSARSSFILKNNMRPLIPAATWAGRYISGPSGIFLGCTINIFGRVGNIRHALSGQSYGDWFVDLPDQLTDISLSFSDGTTIQGNLTINNSNSKTITLLSNESISNTVRISHLNIEPSGDLVINGSATKVALSTVFPEGSSIRYRLALTGSFLQDGGNFSLQDNDQFGGSATLAVAGHIRQTAGTFFTNSNVEDKDFTVEMVGPNYRTSPSGFFISGQGIHLSSGGIDNPRHSITLKLNQHIIGPAFKRGREVGVVLSSPVSVGRLNLITGIIYSSNSNLLTIRNSTRPAITQANNSDTSFPNDYENGYNSSYIVGPFQFYTASSMAYIIPTGSSPTYTPSYNSGGIRDSSIIYHKNTASLLPESALLSQYRAEYFGASYTDSINYATPLQAVAKSKYWDIRKISGADAAITLDLNDSIKGSLFDNAIVVAQYRNDKWVAVNGSVLTPGNTQTGSVTSKVIEDLNIFTFGIITGTNIPLDIKFTGFTARKTNFGAALNWSVESSPSKFEVMRSIDGRSFSTLSGLTNEVNKKFYQFLDDKMPVGVNYYQIKAIELNGNTSLSQIKTVFNSPKTLILNYIRPTEVRESAELSFNSAKAGKMSLIITDMIGRTIKSFDFAVAEGASKETLQLWQLKAGTYQIVAVMNGVPTKPLRFIKTK